MKGQTHSNRFATPFLSFLLVTPFAIILISDVLFISLVCFSLLLDFSHAKTLSFISIIS